MIGITMSSKKAAMLFTLIGLLMFVGFVGSGCVATHDYVRKEVAAASKAQTAEMNTAITKAVGAEKSARTAAITTLREETARKVVDLNDAIKAETEKREALAGDVKSQGEKIVAMAGQIGSHEAALDRKAEKTEMAAVKSSLASYKTEVNRSRARNVVGLLRVKHAPEALSTPIFVFSGFTPGKNDAGKVLEAKDAQATLEALKKFLKDGGEVARVVGTEDPNPCPESNDLCKDNGLGHARAAAFANLLNQGDGQPLVPDPSDKIIGHKVGTDDLNGYRGSRAVVVFVKKSQTPAAAPNQQSSSTQPDPNSAAAAATQATTPAVPDPAQQQGQPAASAPAAAPQQTQGLTTN